MLTRTGARITLLTVRAPKGARITLRCRGTSCPAKRWANTAGVDAACSASSAASAPARG